MKHRLEIPALNEKQIAELFSAKQLHTRKTSLVRPTISTSPTDPSILCRTLGITLLVLAIDIWEQLTGTDKIELAEASGLWTVTLEITGTYRVRTLDKYLGEKNFPKKPRWRPVLQTGAFVLKQLQQKQPYSSKIPELKALVEQLQQRLIYL